jgi:hypothetical protein
LRATRWAVILAAAAGLGIGASLVGCPAAHDGYPTRDCKVAADCFKDELCMDNVCVAPQPDLSIIIGQGFDFSRPDLSEEDGLAQDLSGDDL